MNDTTSPRDDTLEIQVTSPWREMTTMFFRNYAAIAGLVMFVTFGGGLVRKESFARQGAPCSFGKGS